MIRAATPDAIAAAADLIRRGALVAFPTETVYGLGADATDAGAVARVFEVKARPSFDPLIVHIDSAAMLARVAVTVPPTATALIERFWPGPLTIVLPKTARICGITTAGLPSVAVRMPDHPVARALIEAAQCPIAAPSANPFGYVSPTTAAHVDAQLGGQIPLILDGGPCRVGVESTIVSFLDHQPALLRAGGVALEDLERVTGPLRGGTDRRADRSRTTAASLRTAHAAGHRRFAARGRRTRRSGAAAARTGRGDGGLRACPRAVHGRRADRGRGQPVRGAARARCRPLRAHLRRRRPRERPRPGHHGPPAPRQSVVGRRRAAYVSRRRASRYFSDVLRTTSAGSSGAGGCLFQPMLVR
jgi:tRNA threonylcarbamoyl adenosine modification protein (Sua5/YciO/YrdC/YwlC family)